MKYIKWKKYKYIVNIYNIFKIWREVLLFSVLNKEIMPTVCRMWFATTALPYPNLCGFVAGFKDIFIINQIQNIFKETVWFFFKKSFTCICRNFCLVFFVQFSPYSHLTLSRNLAYHICSVLSSFKVKTGNGWRGILNSDYMDALLVIIYYRMTFLVRSSCCVIGKISLVPSGASHGVGSHGFS